MGPLREVRPDSCPGHLHVCSHQSELDRSQARGGGMALESTTDGTDLGLKGF